MKILYPFQDISLKTRKDEEWRVVPGYEGLYEISSEGRIKSLERQVIVLNRAPKPIAERILKLQCRSKKNNAIGDELFTIMVTLYSDGVSYHYSVGRLVYHAFIAPFDLNDKSIIISYRDGDGRNLRYSNLFATNFSDLSNSSYERGRYISKLRKPVSQFDTDGNLIAQYASIYEAGRLNGIKSRSICEVALGGSQLYKGFVWQGGHAKKLKRGKLLKKINAENDPSFSQGILNSDVDTGSSLSLTSGNLEGERWKDFPAYEGLYKISNYGRVRALRKISEGKLQKWYPERIKRLTESNKKNVVPGTKTTLTTTLCKSQKKKTLHVARFVYSLFVKPFDINDASMRVYYKDGNPHNLYYKNLMLKNAAWSINNNKVSGQDSHNNKNGKEN